MGEAHEREQKRREYLREENLFKVQTVREEGIRIAAGEGWVAMKAYIHQVGFVRNNSPGFSFCVM